MAVHRNKGRILSGLLLVALLTGCEGTASQLPSVTGAETAQSEAEPEGTKDAGAQVETKTAALPPAPVIDDDPARVLGLDPEKLTEMLGRPDLTRREPPLLDGLVPFLIDWGDNPSPAASAPVGCTLVALRANGKVKFPIPQNKSST